MKTQIKLFSLCVTSILPRETTLVKGTCLFDTLEDEILAKNKDYYKVKNISSGWMDGWMDDLQFYILFNSFSVISEWCKGDNKRLCAMEPVYD